MTWRNLTRAATICGAAFAAGAGLGAVMPYDRGAIQTAPVASISPNVARAQASDAEIAILSPLREGSPLEEYKVATIEPVGDDGVMRIACTKSGGALRLDVALRSESGSTPPATAGRYAVFYSLEKAPSEDGERLALALAVILRANAAVPIPLRLAPFPAPSP